MNDEFDTERVTETIESHFDVGVSMNYHSEYEETDVWLTGTSPEVAKVVARLAAHPLLKIDVNKAGNPDADVFVNIKKVSIEKLFE